ncbi:PREDICTED: uncharacterized protein LOC108355890 isoform X1 [Rhagoletis zephyria]|uniref:uncharacterized protein LOC108355890 isoform X1 n=1 Tax=Rhagoletis zephyria TaxID=28612 RepID=UPI0008116A47|nr:PREDICTED: uncharacterized protein LOC108355890 isoform X1 [Rhagoletis zephyria]
MNHTSRWRLVREGKLCFNCLKSGHRSNRCTYKHKCSERYCSRMVHELLHADEATNTGTCEVQYETQRSQQQLILTNTTRQPGSSKVLFKILSVTLYANEKEIRCYAFLDEGSSISLMNRSLADRLGLKGTKEKLMLQWLGNNTVTKLAFGVDIQISNPLPGSKKFRMKNVKVVDDLQLPKQTMDISELQCKYRYTQHLPIASFNSACPQLLIGLDNAYLGVAKRTIADGQQGPAVVLTKLGWLVYGKGSQREISEYEQHHSFFAQVGSEDTLENLVRNHIEDDALSVNSEARHVDSAAITRAKDLLEQTTARKERRFETGLLWKSDHVFLPDSKQMAKKRLFALEKKFGRHEDFWKQYTHIMEEYQKAMRGA